MPPLSIYMRTRREYRRRRTVKRRRRKHRITRRRKSGRVRRGGTPRPAEELRAVTTEPLAADRPLSEEQKFYEQNPTVQIHDNWLPDPSAKRTRLRQEVHEAMGPDYHKYAQEYAEAGSPSKDVEKSSNKLKALWMQHRHKLYHKWGELGRAAEKRHTRKQGYSERDIGKQDEAYRVSWEERPRAERDVVRTMTRLKEAIQSHEDQQQMIADQRASAKHWQSRADIEELATLIAAGGGSSPDAATTLHEKVAGWLHELRADHSRKLAATKEKIEIQRARMGSPGTLEEPRWFGRLLGQDNADGENAGSQHKAEEKRANQQIAAAISQLLKESVAARTRRGIAGGKLPPGERMSRVASQREELNYKRAIDYLKSQKR